MRAKFLLSILVLLGGFGSTLRAQQAAPVSTVGMDGGRAVAGQILVRLRPEFDNAATRTRWKALGTLAPREAAQASYRLRLRPGISIEAALAALRARPEVLYAQPNYLRHITADPNDTSYTPVQQYGLPKIKANLAWPLWTPRRQAVVAVVDTGVKTDHPDLANMIYRDHKGAMVGFDATTDSVMTGPNDGHGHGTFCAGIAAAQTNNAMGMASLVWNGLTTASVTYDIKIMPIKVLADNGSGSDEDVAQGMNWAVDHGAEVISLSLGDFPYSALLDEAAQYAWNRGVLVVAAAGNHGNTNLFYPAANANALSVAATDQNDIFASWSAHGSWVDVAAPGVSIYATNKFDGYSSPSGTSMSTPFVAALAAFLKAHNPTLTNIGLSEILRTTCDTLPAQTKSVIHGRINAQAAIQAAKSPPLTGVVTLADWVRIDTTPNKTANLARVFLFPANSSPTSEANALASRDVMLDERGWFSLPAGVVPDGTYRIGVKPVTTYGLAKLVPGNVTLSETNPPPNITLTLLLGDSNRDGGIDVLDLDILIQAFDSVPGDGNWNMAADINGDDSADVLDLDILLRHFDESADFLP